MTHCKFSSTQVGLAAHNAVFIETVTSQTGDLTKTFRNPQNSNIYWLIDRFTLGTDAPRPYKRSFVTHNLISPEDSSVPLPQFQMAPRLKTLMSFGSKRGTQIYYPFLPNVLASEFLSGSPTDPLWVEMPISRAFLSSRVPNKGALPIGPPNCASSERDDPFLQPPSSNSQSPRRRASFQVPQQDF